MAKAAAMVGALFAIALAAMQACSPFGGVNAFTCATDTDCSGGFCEADGLCSFTDSTCASGRRYGELAGGQSGKCVGEVPGDGSVDEQVIGPEAGDSCFGDPGGLVRPCFPPNATPAGALTINANINTDAPGTCSTDATNTTACVIAAANITVTGNVAVTGSKPLVLVATQTIQINGNLDVGSDRGGTPGASSNDPTCDPGTAATNTNGQGGGGGGGSFGTKGGNGGGPGQTRGLSGAAQVPTTLRGGCPGQNGKEGGTANTGGAGGASGGAVYLIADTSITIAGGGGINANGAGGSTGTAPFNRCGGGGGGSGGMIGFDSPAITNGGTVAANGAGGAEGCGGNQGGSQGNNPVGIAGGAASGDITQSGGNGAAGAANTANGNNGGTGNGPAGVSGGGGGGGVGVIRVFRGTIAGQISPPAT